MERVLDFLSITGSVGAACAIYRMLTPQTPFSYSGRSVLFVAASFALLFVILLDRHGDYRPCLSLLAVRDTERILRATVESFFLGLAFAFCFKLPVPRLLLLFTILTSPVLLTFEKWSTYKAVSTLRSNGYGTRKAVIVGTGSLARRLFSALVRSPKFGLDPVALISMDAENFDLEIYESSYHRKRRAKVLAGPVSRELLNRLGASVVVIAEENMETWILDPIITGAAEAGAYVYFAAGDRSEPGSWIEYAEADGVILGHFSSARTRLIYETAKRALDLLIAAISLLCLAPLFALIAGLVRCTSSGPVIFRQTRVGRNGASFTMFKFRSMYSDAATYEESPQVGIDTRITPVGRLLRRTSLDELPQLVNVLLGHMSLVGPRPEMPFLVEQYSPLLRQRLSVKPGITGLWQLSADRAFMIHQNIEYDLYYVRHRSLFMDVAILLHTILFAARGV